MSGFNLAIPANGGGSASASLAPLSSTTVDLNTTNPQDLYTVPAGKTLIVGGAVGRNASIDLSSVGPFVDISRNSDSSSVAPGFDTSILNASDIAMIYFTNSAVFGQSVFSIVAAGDKVQAIPVSTTGAPATVVIDLFGYLV